MESIKLQKDKKYYNFVSTGKEKDDTFIPNDYSVGFLLKTYKSKVENIYKFGNNNQEHELSKTRNFTLDIQSDDLVINGKKIKDNNYWVKGDGILSEVFIERIGRNLIISFATNGYLVINNHLIHFTNIEIGENIQVKNKDGLNYFRCKDLRKIFLNGEEIRVFEMIEDKYIIPHGFDITENFYVQLLNKSFANVVSLNDTLKSRTILIPLNTKFFSFTKNFRCTQPLIEPVYEEKEKKETKGFTVTRYNNETVGLNLECKFIDPVQYKLSKISVTVRHEKELTQIDYSSFSEKIKEIRKVEEKILEKKSSIASFFGFTNQNLETSNQIKIDGLKLSTREISTKILCIFEDDSQIISTVIRKIPIYTEKKGDLIYYQPNKSYNFESDGYYILNNENFENGNKFSVVFNREDSSISLYNKTNQTWTNHEVRQETFFNKKLKKEIYTEYSPRFYFDELGFYDKKETFDIYINDNKLESAKSHYVNTDNIQNMKKKGDNILEKTKITFRRKYDKKYFHIEVTFIFISSMRNNFYINGSDEFGSLFEEENLNGSLSRIPTFFSSYSTYGGYILEGEEDLYLFQNKVNKNSELFNKYPIFEYDNPNFAKIKTCSLTLPIETKALSADLKIQNPSNGILTLLSTGNFKKDSKYITIPKDTLTCCLAVNDKIYFLKSSFLKTNSNGSFSRAASEHRRRTLMTSSPENNIVPIKTSKVFNVEDTQMNNTEENLSKVQEKTSKAMIQHEELERKLQEEALMRFQQSGHQKTSEGEALSKVQQEALGKEKDFQKNPNEEELANKNSVSRQISDTSSGIISFSVGGKEDGKQENFISRNAPNQIVIERNKEMVKDIGTQILNYGINSVNIMPKNNFASPIVREVKKILDPVQETKTLFFRKKNLENYE